MAVSGDYLAVANSRSRPAIHCRHTGDFVALRDVVSRPMGRPLRTPRPITYRYGGYNVIAVGDNHYVYGEMRSLKAVDGELTMRVELVPEESRKQVRRYDVRLFFLEPEATAPGQRVFSVTVQDEPALENFDIFRETGGNMREIAREFKGVEVEDVLEVGLTAGGGTHPPLLCVVEFRLVE